MRSTGSLLAIWLIASFIDRAICFGSCPQGPPTIEEATLFQVECNDTDVVVWTAAANVRLSQLAVSNKSLTVHGFEVILDTLALNGMNLTVIAPIVNCGGTQSLILSTTASPAPVSYPPEAHEPILCSGNGCQGSAGNSTFLPGGKGGNIAIFAREAKNCANTSVTLNSAGGLGGRGEDGGPGIIGDSGKDGLNMDCTIYCDTAGIERPQCKRPWPLLSYHGQQYDTEGRPLYYASLYDAASGVGFGQGAVGEKGGLPGIGGNSTYSGSGGDITLPAELPIIATWAKNSSPGNPTFTLSKNGAPGPGGKGGQGGGGVQSYRSNNYLGHLACANYANDFDAECRGPNGLEWPSGPPGCEISPNSSESCLTAVPQPQVVGTPPESGVINYNFELFSRVVAPQLDMILTAANTAYFNQRYQDAAAAYVFLSDVCNVTANMERLPKCASLNILATQKLSQMSKGFDFYGDVANFTPLLRLTFLKDYVTGQLKIIEGAYGIYWKAETSSADKKAALSSAAGSNDDTIIALLSKQGGILTQQNASFYEFLALAGQRSTANVALNAADTAFKEAVNRARANMPSFMELLGLIASTVAQVGLDVAGVGKITGDLEKVIGIKGQEDRFINDRKIATSFSGAGFVVDTVQSKLYPAWKTYAQESNTFNDDATKISSDSQQFAEYLQTYKDLPEAQAYKQDLSAFQQYQQLGSQIEALKADNADIKSQLPSLNINPAEISFANFIAGLHKQAQQSVVQAIYQLNQGSNSHTVKLLDPYILDASTAGFASLLRPNGNLTFYISSDDPVFYDLAQFYATHVVVTFYGKIGGEGRVNVDLTHQGTPTVISTSCEKYSFTHASRDATYSFEAQDPSRVIIDGYLGGCGTGTPSDVECSDIYIGLSLFSYWTMSLPGRFDYSQVTGIGLAFSGQARTPSRNSCFQSVAASLPSPLGILKSPLRPAVGANSSFQSQSGEEHAGMLPTCTTVFAGMEFQIDLDFAELLLSFSNGLLMENGQLRFPLPELNGTVALRAHPVLPGYTSSVAATGLVSSMIGRASLAISGPSSYGATIVVEPPHFLAAAVLNPTFTGLYSIKAELSFIDEEVNDWLQDLDTTALTGLLCNPLATLT